MRPRARTLLAEDHTLVREAVRDILHREPDFEVVAEASDGAQALELALAARLDLVIVDVSMPKLTGIDVARQLLAHRPHIRVVVLTVHDDEDLLYRALRAGASAYVVKSAAAKDLVQAARAALRGEVYLYPRDLQALASSFVEALGAGAEELPDELTDRELEVLKLVAEGHTNEEIGGILHISPRTVARHRANTLTKLGMRDRVDLTRYAIRRGLVEP